MKTDLFAVVAALTVLATSTAARPAVQAASGDPVAKAFARGGAIRMKLTAGDYRISGRNEDMIRVSWRTDRSEDARNLKAEAELRGTTAVIVTSGAKRVHFTIEVPARSDIDVDLTAGDLEIGGIEGNKRVESWAGDLSIDVGRPEQYRTVDASVRAGDLNARPFNISKGGLLRSFHWTGHGPYALAVRLFAGDLTLR